MDLSTLKYGTEQQSAESSVEQYSCCHRRHPPYLFAAFVCSFCSPCPQAPVRYKKEKEEREREHCSSMAGSDLAHPGLAVLIMGVSGCGKSTVAALLAEALGCSFIEADDYHSQANKAKMRKGIPLTDADRIPWLESHRDAIRERLDRSEDVAVSCSALQQKYREILREGDCNYKTGSYATCRVKFVCLDASAEVIAERMRRRSMEGKHFMPASLLQSQLDLLQIDEAEGITQVDARVRPDAIVHDTIAQFRAFELFLISEPNFIIVQESLLLDIHPPFRTSAFTSKKDIKVIFNVTQFIQNQRSVVMKHACHNSAQQRKRKEKPESS